MKLRSLINRYINRETVLYVLFGVMTTVINYAVYWLCLRTGIIPYWLANIIAWIFAVAAAFVTNKIWVFESRSWSAVTIGREIALFAAARLFSLAIEEAFLLITVGALHANEMIMKLIAAVFVIVANYIFSKYIIFKKGKSDE